MTYDQQFQAYTNASHMVRKTKQVVMLYEGTIRAVQQARQAIVDNNIQERYNKLTKACEILNGLQLSLDHVNGGKVAALLNDYYSGLDMRLMSLHQSNDLDICDMCIEHLKMMKEAWDDVDRQQDESEQSTSNKQSVNTPYDTQISIAPSQQNAQDDDETRDISDTTLSAPINNNIDSIYVNV